MSYSEPEKYFNLAGFMSGAEVDQIFDILENALDRKVGTSLKMQNYQLGFMTLT